MSVREDKILKEAIDRLKLSADDDGDNRRNAFEDLEFVAIEGKQWPDEIRAERETNGQPCLTVNKLPTYIDQVVGDQRMNRPSIKVLPADNKADPEIARLLGGWIKHVQQISSADIAIDHGFEHAVTCGYGAIRVVTEYSSDSSFEQEAYIQQIDNALAIYWGPHSKYDCSDAEYCFIVSDLPREEYKEKYEEDPMPFSVDDSRYVEGWSTKETIRVVEYFVKERKEKTVYLLKDGRVVNELAEGDEEEKHRKVNSYEIKWYLLSGDKILDEKIWIGKKYIPIIPIWGKEVNVGGKRTIRGLIRFAKDPQRMLNYWNSCDTETVALQPKVPYMVTPKQIDGHENMWNQAHKKNYPYLLANPDKDAPGWPQRQTPPQASSAMVEKLAGANQDIRDTTGLQQANLGMKSNERSGIAIRERKQEGDVGTFSFVDNLARSIEHVGRVLVDIAPQLLDTERIVRLGLTNGEFEFDAVNVIDPKDPGKVLHDLSIGTYDVTVTVGPSFTTQRTEANISMREFIQYYPNAAPLIGDLYAKSMDWPGAEEVSERLEFLLPPEVKAKKAAEAAKKAGEPPPPPPAPPPPPPEEVIKLEEEKLKLQEAQIKLQQEQEKLRSLILKNELMVAESKEGIKKLLDEIMQEEQERMKALNEQSGGGDKPVEQPPTQPQDQNQAQKHPSQMTDEEIMQQLQGQ